MFSEKVNWLKIEIASDFGLDIFLECFLDKSIYVKLNDRPFSKRFSIFDSVANDSIFFLKLFICRPVFILDDKPNLQTD